MQNLFLLHLREQRRVTPKQIEQRTGIPAGQYLQYEKGTLPMSNTDAVLLSTFFKIKCFYLSTYSVQLEYFTHAEAMLRLKEKRIEQLTKALKRAIKKTPLHKPKSCLL